MTVYYQWFASNLRPRFDHGKRLKNLKNVFSWESNPQTFLTAILILGILKLNILKHLSLCFFEVIKKENCYYFGLIRFIKKVSWNILEDLFDLF
jgi:hypothetical protein